MEEKVKISQRPAKSCTECSRRKTRCTKSIPCEPCTKRGVPHLCKQESQYAISVVPSPSPTTLAADYDPFRALIYEEINALKKRVAQLEKTSATIDRPPTTVDVTDGPPDVATTLEFFALGLDRRIETQESGGSSFSTLFQTPTSELPSHAHILAEPQVAPPESISNALLPQVVTGAIFRFHADNVHWQHGCVHLGHFQEQVEKLYETIHVDGGWNRIDAGWSSLFFTLQAISVHQMPENYGQSCGLGNDVTRQDFAAALMAAGIASLHYANFLSRPSVFICQTIAVLGLCGHNVCDSDLLSSLLALGIKHAQTLGLHSLAKARVGMSSVDLELGRRIWWSLATEDWFAIPFRGVWSIHRDHFDTPLPSNCNDDDLLSPSYLRDHEPPSYLITTGFKSQFLARIALILQSTFASLRKASPSETYKIAESATDNISQLIDQLPAPHPSHPPWVIHMRHYLRISSYHKMIVIYRAYLSGKNNPVANAATVQQQCVNAAQAIIDELDTQAGSQTLWTIPYHALAAAVVLMLDLTDSGRDIPETKAKRRLYIAKATEGLERLARTSRIARRGLQVIGHLTRATAGGKRKGGPEDSVDTMVKKIRMPDHDTHAHDPIPSPSASTSMPAQRISSPPAVHPILEQTQLYSWSQEDADALMASLQEALPDVGRLFDGSLGTFGWGFGNPGPTSQGL